MRDHGILSHAALVVQILYVGGLTLILMCRRDSLDVVAAEMLRAQDVPTCMACIEEVDEN